VRKLSDLMQLAEQRLVSRRDRPRGHAVAVADAQPLLALSDSICSTTHLTGNEARIPEPPQRHAVGIDAP
jgi:hypothetical protein